MIFPHISLQIFFGQIYSFCQIFPALRLFFFPNFPGPTFIQGPMFILFTKSSRPYAYSLPYAYYRLQSTKEQIIEASFDWVPPKYSRKLKGIQKLSEHNLTPLLPLSYLNVDIFTLSVLLSTQLLNAPCQKQTILNANANTIALIQHCQKFSTQS